MKRLFVTGTDTGVGKSRIACALVSAWRSDVKRVGVLKPIETGCRRAAGNLVGEDSVALAAAAGLSDDASASLYRYDTPASPLTAARLDGLPPPQLSSIQVAVDRLTASHDVVVVEGAGGLLVPITNESDMADLAAALDSRVLIVARTGLGTINHTLLTIQVARMRGLPIAGVIFNATSAEPGPEAQHVPSVVASRCAVPILGVFPFLPGPIDLDALAILAKKHLAYQTLWDAL